MESTASSPRGSRLVRVDEDSCSPWQVHLDDTTTVSVKLTEPAAATLNTVVQYTVLYCISLKTSSLPSSDHSEPVQGFEAGFCLNGSSPSSQSSASQGSD